MDHIIGNVELRHNDYNLHVWVQQALFAPSPIARFRVRSRFPTLWTCLLFHTHTNKHTEPFNGPLSGTTQVGRYEKKHSPTHTHPDHQTSFINFLHLLRSIASSVFSLSAWQSSLTTSLQVLFRLPLGLGPSTSYSMHFFTQSSSFRYTRPYTAACSARFCSCLLFQYN